MALADYRALTAAKLRDTAGIITPEQLGGLIQEAIRQYSILHPRQRVQTLTGNGVKVTFDLASDFEEGFSSISEIEYPVGRTPPEFIASEEWRYYRDPTAGVIKLRLLVNVLGNAVAAYATYSARHAVTEGTGAVDTIPLADLAPVCDLAASLGFEELAAYFGEEVEPSLGSDLTRGQDRARFYLDMAQRRRDAWEAAMGIGAKSTVAAASKSLDLDVDLFFLGGPDRFFHGRLGR